MANPIILCNDKIAELLTVSECIPIIENLFKNLDNSYMPPKTYLNIPNGDFRAMPAIVDNTAGIKWCGVHMDDTGTKRKVNIFAKVLINDTNTGKLLAIMDGEVLTAIRTAAVTGVATKYLAPDDSKIAAFIGCGNQTKRQIEAILAVRDIEKIFLYDLDPARAEKVAQDFDNTYVFSDLESCLRQADIITTLTPSRKGFIPYKFIKPRAHINAVGADAKGKRELDVSILSNMGIIVYDEWEQCSHSGEIQYLSESERRPVLFSLGEIVRRSYYYSNSDRVMGTLFDATGLAVEDVVTARYIYEKIK
jgi:ornithine cyclodeaminase/alanine dehydrogenase-like protein (mu-crystallin family)